MSGPLASLAAIAPDVWLVGGALRDELLGRETEDYDVVLSAEDEGTIAEVARALARAENGFAFALSDTFGAWRVVENLHRWQVDLTPLGGDTIDADLARRDLTVNAIARSLGTGALADPTGGREDLAAGRLRAVSDRSFRDDPLRTVRIARFVAELGFAVTPETLRLARASAPGLVGVAPERVLAELKRLLSADGAIAGLDLLDAAGVTEIILPELAALRGVEQSRFHHLDVLGHTRAVLAELIALQRDPEMIFGSDAPAVAAVFDEPLANELTRGQALRFGALLHDIAKPQTRDVSADGRITFIGHDTAGAQLGRVMLGRLRASERLAEFVAAVTREHLRLGFLVHQVPLERRAVYRYLHACAPVSVEVTALSVADRLATRGDNAERAIARHLDLARQMVRAGLAWRADPPRPPVRGDTLARALGLAPGPRIGQLLQLLEEAGYAGEIGSEAEAIAYARERSESDG
ncbi:MAG: HD domain-containing protein [Solirubrobacteraceae bacterium]